MESSNEVITSDFVLGVQSIQNGNNMHKEVYKDLHKMYICVYKSIQRCSYNAMITWVCKEFISADKKQ